MPYKKTFVVKDLSFIFIRGIAFAEELNILNQWKIRWKWWGDFLMVSLKPLYLLYGWRWGWAIWMWVGVRGMKDTDGVVYMAGSKSGEYEWGWWISTGRRYTFLNGGLGKKRVWVLNLFSAAPRNFLGHVIFLNLDGWLKLSGWYSNTKNPPTMGKKNPEIIYIWFNYGRIFVTFEMIFISEVFPDYFI